jgi:hypothetical protein
VKRAAKLCRAVGPTKSLTICLKAHNQQSMRENPTKANRFTHLRIGMYGVKVIRGPHVVNQLQVRDRGLHQWGQGFAGLDVFVIPLRWSLTKEWYLVFPPERKCDSSRRDRFRIRPAHNSRLCLILASG